MPIQLATAYVAIVPSMKNVGKSIAEAFGSASDAQGAEQGKKAGAGFARGLGATGAIIGAASAITSKAMNVIGSSISGAVSHSDQMNNFPKVMRNLGYSSDDAAKSIKKISAALDGLPTTTSSMTSMVQQLAPLTSNLNEATEISLAFNNAMLAGGASTEEQANALTQYTQMLAAGKVDMQAWRSIQAAMPGQLNQIAEALLGAGKNGNDLYEAMKNGSISFDDFNGAVNRLNSDGFGQYASFTQQAKDATQGIGTAMENVQNRVQKAWQKVIEAIGVENIAGAINRISSQFGKIGDVVADVVTFVKNNADIFAPIAAGIGGAVAVIGAFGTAVKIAAAAQLIFNAAMTANPVMLMVTAIAALVAGLAYFFTQTQLGQQIWQGFIGWLMPIWNQMLAVWTPLWAAISSYFSGTWNAIQIVVQTVMGVIQGIIQTVTALISGDWQGVWDGIKNIAMVVWNGISSLVGNAINMIRNVISNVLNAISAIWNAVWSGIGSFFSNIWEGLKSAASNGVNAVMDVVRGIKSKITGFFSGAGDWLVGAGKALLQGLWNGINNAVGWVVKQISGIKDAIVGGIKSLFGIHSPSRVMRDEVGVMIGKGLAVGIQQTAGIVDKAVDALMPDLTDSWDVNPIRVATATGRQSSSFSQSGAYASGAEAGSVVNNNWKVNIQRGDDLDSAATILYRNVMMDRRRM